MERGRRSWATSGVCFPLLVLMLAVTAGPECSKTALAHPPDGCAAGVRTKKKRAARHKKSGKRRKRGSQQGSAKAHTTPRKAHVGEVPFKPLPIESAASAGPSDAVISVLVDVREVRRSPHQAHYRHLLKSVPDYLRVVGGAQLEPIDAYDRVLMASTDPSKLTETLLVATSSIGEDRLAEMLDEAAGEKLGWKRTFGIRTARPEKSWWVKRGDQRLFMRPRAGVVAFGPKDTAPWLRAHRRDFLPELPAALGKRGTLPTVLLAEMQGDAVPFAGKASGLPPPSTVRLAVHDDKRPLVRVLLSFDTKTRAAFFLQRWPTVQRELTQWWTLSMLGYAELISRVQTCPAGESGVYMQVRTSQEEIRRLTRFLAQVIRNRTQAYRPRKDELGHSVEGTSPRKTSGDLDGGSKGVK